MPFETKSLEFGPFHLDLREKELLRNGERVPTNPKTFQLLVTLIENHGHLVEKERLMKTLWAETFVEEANLAFTVSLLRKALGDDASKPRFIETVPRRGYRFIAEVRENGHVNVPPTAQHVESEVRLNSPRVAPKLLAYASTLMIVAVFAGGLWYVRSGIAGGDAPILSADFSSENISTDGNSNQAVISRDGKRVVYTNRREGRQSVWIRHLETSSNVQILPPSEDFYYGLALSPDAQTLYFVRGPRDSDDLQYDTYAVSIFGGIPKKIISGTQGWLSLSPDGKTISYVRCPYREDEYCSLCIADAADGQNERKLVSRANPIKIGDNEFAPDGKTIAFAVGHARTGGNEFEVAEVDVESGKERTVTGEKFFYIRHLTWLPSGKGLFLTANKLPDNNFRIWHFSDATGRATALTHDSENYDSLSLDETGSLLVSEKYKPDYRLSVYRRGNEQPQELAEASTVGYTASGTIVFSSALTGNHEIWAINADGSQQRQLTLDPAADLNPVVSPDTNHIFFVSNRSGEAQVWRMRSDGTEPRQLTSENGGTPLLVSPDGNWLYYVSARGRNLMRISTSGGKEESVLDKSYNYHFAISPDASQVAFSESLDGRTVIRVVSLTNGGTIRSFEVPKQKSGVVQVVWSPDGKSLFYVSPDDITKNNTIWEQSVIGGRRIRITDIGRDELRETRSFAISPDGQSFAVVQGRWKHDAVLLRGLK